MKQRFTDAQIVDFLRKSYFVVDGLWFMKTEEKRGFDEAVEQDEAVWEVMPKIQARKAKAILGIENGSLEDLCKAFQLKLNAEGYEFDVESDKDKITLKISVCPWFEVLKSSNRTHIAEVICDKICMREFTGWAKEFGGGIEFEFLQRLCMPSDNCDECQMVFKRQKV